MLKSVSALAGGGRVARRRRFSSLYNWSQHFAGGQQGYVLLPSRAETLFQDDAGSTPLTAAGQTVGRIMDVSGRDNHFTQSTSGFRPTYRLDTSDRAYLEFGGVDDFLSSGTITPGSDKVCVVLGIRKLSDASTAALLEASANPNINAGSFWVLAPNLSNTYSFLSRGTGIGVVTSAASFASPITNIVTGLGDISGDSTILRVNGTQVASAATDQGTGNFLAYQHFLGQRGGTSFPFSGRVYGVFVRYGGLPDATELAQIEAAMNDVTGAF